MHTLAPLGAIVKGHVLLLGSVLFICIHHVIQGLHVEGLVRWFASSSCTLHRHGGLRANRDGDDIRKEAAPIAWRPPAKQQQAMQQHAGKQHKGMLAKLARFG